AFAEKKRVLVLLRAVEMLIGRRKPLPSALMHGPGVERSEKMFDGFGKIAVLISVLAGFEGALSPFRVVWDLLALRRRRAGSTV
ncbi:MAG: hypothetical protein WD407_04740, partial [Rhodospirillales bacterium]